MIFCHVLWIICDWKNYTEIISRHMIEKSPMLWCLMREEMSVKFTCDVYTGSDAWTCQPWVMFNFRRRSSQLGEKTHLLEKFPRDSDCQVTDCVCVLLCSVSCCSRYLPRTLLPLIASQLLHVCVIRCVPTFFLRCMHFCSIVLE